MFRQIGLYFINLIVNSKSKKSLYHMQPSFRHKSPSPMRISLKRNKANYIMTTNQRTAETIKYHYNQDQHHQNSHIYDQTTHKPNQYQAKLSLNNHAGLIKQFDDTKAGHPDSNRRHLKLLNDTLSQKFQQGYRERTGGIKHYTHSYVSSQHSGQYEEKRKTKKFYMGDQFGKTPKIITEIYERQYKQSHEQGRLHFTEGYIKQIGYFYYAIHNKLVFINYETLIENRNSVGIDKQIDILELEQPVVSVMMLETDHLKFNNHEIHPLGQHTRLLIISHNWSISFYTFSEHLSEKFKSLNLKINMPCQFCRMLVFSKNGSLYYLDSQCRLGRITITAEMNCFRKKSFSIRNYIFTNKSKIKRRQNLSRQFQRSLWQRVASKIEDIKDLFSKKTNKPLQILYHEEDNVVFTLTQTITNNDVRTAHRQIRMYKVQQAPESLASRLAWSMYQNPPIILRSISEQQLYTTIGEHLFIHLNMSNFSIKGIHLLRKSHKSTANILVILCNGSRIYLQLTEYQLIVVQLINLPEIEGIKGAHYSALNQKEPINLKIIDYLYSETSWVTVFMYSRRIMCLLFSGLDSDKEQITVLWEQQDRDIDYSINSSDFKIFQLPIFSYYSPKKVLWEKILGNYDGNSVNQKMWQNQLKCIVTIKENRKLLKVMRAIDYLYQLMYNMQTSFTLYSNTTCLQTVYQEYKKLYNHTTIQELLQLLLQIYSDVEGTYFYRVLKSSNPKYHRYNHEGTENDYLFVESDFDESSNSNVAKMIQEIFGSINSNSQVFQRSIMDYLSNLLMPVWQQRLFLIPSRVFTYLLRIIEHLEKLLSTSSLYRNVNGFLGDLKQTFNLVSEVEELGEFLFKQILNCEAQNLEQSLFFSFQKTLKQNQRLNRWIANFPKFLPNSLIRAIKLCEQLRGKDKKELKKQLLTGSNSMPLYLISYFYRMHRIDEQTLRSLMVKLTSIDKIDVRELMPSKQSNPYEKYLYCIRQVKNPSYNWHQKQFLLMNAEQNLMGLTQLPTNNILQKKSELRELKKLIKVQKILKENIQQKIDEGIDFSNDTIQIINHVTLTKQQLEGLLQNLSMPELLFIYYANFGGNSSKILFNIQTLFSSEELTSIARSQPLHQKIKKLLDKIDGGSLQANIPLHIIMKQLNKLVYKCVRQTNLSKKIQIEGLKQRFTEELWVAFELLSSGYTKLSIFDGLLGEMDTYQEHSILQYYMISVCLFVKFSYREGYQQLEIFAKRKERELKGGQTGYFSKLLGQVL